MLRGALAGVPEADDRLVLALNATARRSRWAAWIVGRLAAWLAGVEVLLMLALALAGRRDSAVRMLAAVSVVYVLSEALGTIWPRRRPFARLAQAERLARHSPQRSFPSRHLASGLAMAIVGGQPHPRLGTAMATVAWLLGLSRVAAGLHYPSDLLGGALVGAAVGLVYVVCDALGRRWPRGRPFAQLTRVERLAPHSAGRSFPSRHVASGLAMAAVGGQAHPRLGTAMATVAWALGLSRVAAGLHYPSDVLGGALSGAAVGRLALSRPGSPARPGRS